MNELLIRLRIENYRGAVTVMRTRHGQIMAGRRDLGWAPVVEGPLKMIDVPGAHVTVLDPPHLNVLVQRTLECLSESLYRPPIRMPRRCPVTRRRYGDTMACVSTATWPDRPSAPCARGGTNVFQSEGDTPSVMSTDLPGGVCHFDVREEDEWAAGHAPDAVRNKFQRLSERICSSNLVSRAVGSFRTAALA